MKRISLSLSFLVACVFGSACAGEEEVTCEVIWSADGVEVGSAMIVYDGDDVDAAVEDCLIDQADHEDRPATATMHNCNCST